MINEVTTLNGYWTAPLYEADDKTRVDGAPRIPHPYPQSVEFGGRTFALREGGHGKGGRLSRYVATP